MNTERYLHIISGESVGPLAAGARALLSAMTPAYRAAVAARNRLFDLGVRTPVRLRRPVISVGNLTTGGVGKTPMVVALCQMLLDRGEKPAVLLRGYHADADGRSDEAEQLRVDLPEGVPVQPNPDRVAGAHAVLDRHPDTTLFVLDDGFQHRRAARDLDLVLVDATQPFGHGRLLPRGLLREPLANLARAHAVIITHADQVEPHVLAGLDDAIARRHGRPPVAHAAHAWTGFRGGDHDRPDPSRLAVAAITGIGNPAAFEKALVGRVGRLIWHRALEDHHVYRMNRLIRLLADAKRDGAEAVVTTEKDWVKWAALFDGIDPLVPVLRPVLAIDFIRGRDALAALLDPVLAQSGDPS